jgi:large subunit ribosomal protein L9
MELETGETGKAFGSITAADLAEKIKAELGGKIVIDRHRIHLEKPIKEKGAHEVTVKLHHDVTAKFVVNVKTKGGEEEAEAGKEEAKGEKGEKDDKGYKAKVKARHTK